MYNIELDFDPNPTTILITNSQTSNRFENPCSV